jgi:MSHA pilin protein MshD
MNIIKTFSLAVTSIPNHLRYKGYTLIELVVSMTIIAIALIGTLMAINMAVLYSGDPVLRQQAMVIAESYLEEIGGKNFPTTPCPSGTRSTFTNICNYNDLSEAPTSQDGTPMAGLGAYTVNVAVDSTSASLGSPSLVPGTQVVRIDVTVFHAPMTPMKFSLYRTNY